MNGHEEDYRPDFGIIAPIAIPPGSRVPDRVSGQSTSTEYDRYFRIRRDHVGLREWTSSCLEVQQRVLADLADTGLTAEEHRSLLHGLVLTGNEALRQWIAVSGDAGEQADGASEPAAALPEELTGMVAAHDGR